MDAECIIIGAGPAGLAAARELLRRGVELIVLERGPTVATSWRSRHDHLRLNTHRWFSHQPGMRIPAAVGSYPARDDYVGYLEAYVDHFSIPVRYATEVTRITQCDDGWTVHCNRGELNAPHVIIATGPDLVPVRPQWPGEETFTGEIIHAAAFRNAASCRGRDVLVVGAGNSGIDLLNHLVTASDVGRLWLSARTGPALAPLRVFGVPLHPLAVSTRFLPDRVNDRLLKMIGRVALGDLTRHGLPSPPVGGFTRFRRQFIGPAVDDGFAAALKHGRVTVRPPIASFETDTVRFTDGSTCEPDLVISATGYHSALESLVADLVVLDRRGLPPFSGATESPRHPGLWIFGLNSAVVGSMHIRRREARQLGRRLARRCRVPQP